jgi:hypothetical protein
MLPTPCAERNLGRDIASVRERIVPVVPPEPAFRAGEDDR